jgi:hypothetical protein
MSLAGVGPLMSNKLSSAMAIEREGRVVGKLAIKAAAEPPVGQVEMHLFTQSPLGAEGKAIGQSPDRSRDGQCD